MGTLVITLLIIAAFMSIIAIWCAVLELKEALDDLERKSRQEEERGYPIVEVPRSRIGKTDSFLD